MTQGNALLSAELLHQVEDTARDQNRNPSDVISDAVRRYLEEQSWLKFVESNERHARAQGIREEDVDRLIAEVRREKAENSR